jgi:hypothetical protein
MSLFFIIMSKKNRDGDCIHQRRSGKKFRGGRPLWLIALMLGGFPQFSMLE